jgi:hypothetical protein
MADKNEIRRHLRLEMRRRRAAFNDPARSMAVRGIMANLASLLWPLRDANIHVYLAFTDEVNLHPFYQKLLDSGANLYTSKIAAGGQLSHHRLERLDDLQGENSVYLFRDIPGLLSMPPTIGLSFRGWFSIHTGIVLAMAAAIMIAFWVALKGSGLVYVLLFR